MTVPYMLDIASDDITSFKASRSRMEFAKFRHRRERSHAEDQKETSSWIGSIEDININIIT